MAINWRFVHGATLIVYMALVGLIAVEVTIWATGLRNGKGEIPRRLGLHSDMKFLAPSFVTAAAESPKAQATEGLGSHHNGYYDPDYGYSDSDIRQAQALLYLIEIAAFSVLGIMSCGQCCYGFYHYTSCIKPTQDKFIPRGAIAPADMHGGFKYGFCDCCGDCKTCCGFYWCTPWFVSELIFRAGHMHAMTDIPADSPATAYIYAVLGLIGASCLGVSACFPCAMGALRGGFMGDDIGGTTSLRTLFHMPNSGCMTYTGDTCAWWFCPICAGVQEMRQVMDLLDRGTPVVANAPGTVQMQAAPYPQYGASPPQYGASPPQHGAPPPQYGAPPPQYGAPPPQYGAPPPQYGAPPPSAPQYRAPPPQYGAPPPQYA